MKISLHRSSMPSRIAPSCMWPLSAVPARRAWWRQGIHPMKVAQPELITDLLEKLQVVLRGTPPPWLRKVLAKGNKDQERSFDFEEDEEVEHG